MELCSGAAYPVGSEARGRSNAQKPTSTRQNAISRELRIGRKGEFFIQGGIFTQKPSAAQDAVDALQAWEYE